MAKLIFDKRDTELHAELRDEILKLLQSDQIRITDITVTNTGHMEYVISCCSKEKWLS